MTRFECVSHAEPWLMLPFLLGSILLNYLIAKNNKLDLKGTFLAMVGLKKIKRTYSIVIVHVAVLSVPIALFMWQLGLCDTTLFKS